MGEGTVFSLFVSPHLDRGGGGGLPRSGLDGRGGGYAGQVWMVGGYSSQVWMVGGGTLVRSGWLGGGYSSQVWMMRGYPGQVWMVEGGTPARSGWWGVPRVPPMTGWGTPPP